MKILDITLPISPALPLYPGDPAVEITPWTRLAGGEPFAVSRLSLGSHTGTHVDAPAHCIAGGATVDTLPLLLLCGPAYLVDLVSAAEAPFTGLIGPDQLASIPTDCPRVLFRTHGGEAWRHDVTPQADAALAAETADILVERGVRLVGIDRLSIAPTVDPLPVHRLLLAAGLIIVEGLDLRNATAGLYTLFCLPLNIAGGDGAPARAVLVRA